MLDTLDAAAVRRWCADGLAALRHHQDEIDRLNVYPVPDGDTGTNLVLTLTSAHHALALDLDNSPEGARPPHSRVLRLMARGALLGARGNSGVIVAQILHGLADALAGTAQVRGRDLAGALDAAAAAAYAAVASPVEGTVLTVAAAAARGAATADSDDLATVARAASRSAAAALARTPEQLPALARAGVVDAGGRGLCVLLDTLTAVVTGAEPPGAEPPGAEPPGAEPSAAEPSAAGAAGSGSAAGGPPPVAVEPSAAGPPDRPPVVVAREAGSPEFAYEVRFLLDAEPPAVERMRATLAGLGDSLVVVGTGADDGELPTWHVHVHVNDIGAAIEAGIVAGRPHQIAVTRFDDQVDGAPAAEPADPAARPGDGPGRAAVVVAAGDGLAALFVAEGAVVVAGRPSTGELLDAIRSTGATQVVVLPNDPNTQAVARAAAEEAQHLGLRVSVVPTRSPVQALAALAVRDSGRRFDDDVIEMAEAAGACRSAEVCFAGREALTMAGRCQPGDVLALVEGEVHVIGTDLGRTCEALLDRMLGGGGELVTMLLGADAPAGLGEALRDYAARRWPFVEVHSYDGGQPFYPLLVGVE
ncbi:DAK2 domain-containing protein [Polymorphospora rubra]|uniref:DAK2 domain-containing protein n=1 Tax=Polymorphospora rubra TaxID=338584 RepID=UPI001BB2F839|nr:DAK2 domain-containing protein [Polymorphospora rubra]